MDTPSLPQAYSAGDQGALGVRPLCAGYPPPQKLDPLGCLPEGLSLSHMGWGWWEARGDGVEVAGSGRWQRRGWCGFAGRGVSAAPHRGAGGKLGGGSRWWQVDFNTGVGPVPSGVCTAPGESRPPCWGGSGCPGVRGCSGCPGGSGPWAKAAHSPASKGCQWLSPGAPLPPCSRLRSPILLPTSPGVQPPHPRLRSVSPPAAWGLPPRPEPWGTCRAVGDHFPARPGCGRTEVASCVLCPPMVGARAWGPHSCPPEDPVCVGGTGLGSWWGRCWQIP